MTHDMMMLPAAWLQMIGRTRFAKLIGFALQQAHIAASRTGPACTEAQCCIA